MRERTLEYDVIIAGAGPAGSSAAIHLAALVLRQVIAKFDPARVLIDRQPRLHIIFQLALHLKAGQRGAGCLCVSGGRSSAWRASRSSGDTAQARMRDFTVHGSVHGKTTGKETGNAKGQKANNMRIITHKLHALGIVANGIAHSAERRTRQRIHRYHGDQRPGRHQIVDLDLRAQRGEVVDEFPADLLGIHAVAARAATVGVALRRIPKDTKELRWTGLRLRDAGGLAPPRAA